jgi:hypothetical protein
MAELVVTVGREGKQPLRLDPERSPYTAAMAVKLRSDEGRAAYRRRKCALRAHWRGASGVACAQAQRLRFALAQVGINTQRGVCVCRRTRAKRPGAVAVR